MKPFAITALLAAWTGVCAAQPQTGSQQLVEQKMCTQCHAMDKDGAGPAFRKIAAKWRDRKDAEKVLVATIRGGSDATKGPHWGKATMPDQAQRPQVSAGEAREMVRWILKQ